MHDNGRYRCQRGWRGSVRLSVPGLLTVSRGTDGRMDARHRQLGGTFFTRRPRQPTNTHYKAANIENEYSGAALFMGGPAIGGESKVGCRALRGTVFFISILSAPAEFLTITARTRNMCVTLLPAHAMCMSTPARTCKTYLWLHNKRDALILCLLLSRRRKHIIL